MTLRRARLSPAPLPAAAARPAPVTDGTRGVACHRPCRSAGERGGWGGSGLRAPPGRAGTGKAGPVPVPAVKRNPNVSRPSRSRYATNGHGESTAGYLRNAPDRRIRIRLVMDMGEGGTTQNDLICVPRSMSVWPSEGNQAVLACGRRTAPIGCVVIGSSAARSVPAFEGTDPLPASNPPGCPVPDGQLPASHLPTGASSGCARR